MKPLDRLPLYNEAQCKECACTVCTKEQCNMCSTNPCEDCQEQLNKHLQREPITACWDTNKKGKIIRGVIPDEWV